MRPGKRVASSFASTTPSTRLRRKDRPNPPRSVPSTTSTRPLWSSSIKNGPRVIRGNGDGLPTPRRFRRSSRDLSYRRRCRWLRCIISERNPSVSDIFFLSFLIIFACHGSVYSALSPDHHTQKKLRFEGLPFRVVEGQTPRIWKMTTTPPRLHDSSFHPQRTLHRPEKIGSPQAIASLFIGNGCFHEAFRTTKGGNINSMIEMSLEDPRQRLLERHTRDKQRRQYAAERGVAGDTGLLVSSLVCWYFDRKMDMHIHAFARALFFC